MDPADGQTDSIIMFHFTELCAHAFPASFVARDFVMNYDKRL